VTHQMVGRCLAAATAVLLAGCTAKAPASVPPGVLVPGTAEISINGAQVGSTYDVQCSQTGPQLLIDTGDDAAGTHSMIRLDNAAILEFTQIRNVDGFTGSYWNGLGPEAEVQLNQNTFSITGVADGFAEDNPSARISQPFSIKVAC